MGFVHKKFGSPRLNFMTWCPYESSLGESLSWTTGRGLTVIVYGRSTIEKIPGEVENRIQCEKDPSRTGHWLGSLPGSRANIGRLSPETFTRGPPDRLTDRIVSGPVWRGVWVVEGGEKESNHNRSHLESVGIEVESYRGFFEFIVTFTNRLKPFHFPPYL